jgi:hypothetical protein
VSPGAVANDAENGKVTNYFSLSGQYCFVPVAMETLGAPGDEALVFFRDLAVSASHRIATAEPRSSQFLMQHASVAVQRSVAALRPMSTLCLTN